MFRSLKCRSGKIAGHRLAAVLVEIGDDDQPVAQIEPAKPKGGDLAKLAGIWCNDSQFYQWIRPIYDVELGGNGLGHGDLEIGYDVIGWQGFCRHAILYFCGTYSRAELDNDEEAAERFHRLIRIPYSQWLKERSGDM